MDFDVVVNGGGLAGASLAVALSSIGLKIALIEAKDFDRVEQPSFDTRYLALTYGTGLVFRGLGLWQELEGGAVTDIKQIEVTNEDRRGLAHLKSNDVGVEVLGWNVAASALGNAIVRRIRQLDCVKVFSCSKISDTYSKREFLDLNVQTVDSTDTRSIRTKLLVIADGGGSGLREKFKFKVHHKPYSQQALICRVESDKNHRGMAYEHFLDSGPMALLPVGKSCFSIVWTLEKDEIGHSMEVPEQQFLTEIQRKFGSRAGQFIKLVSPRVSYPLRLSHLKKFVCPRVVVVGNASHTVHPVAGQGFNLALRDIAALAEVLDNHYRWGWDIGSYDVLAHYERWRTRESKAVAWFTDHMIEVFSDQSRAFSATRNFCLNMIGSSPILRKALLTRTMGLFGKQSRLMSNH